MAEGDSAPSRPPGSI